MKTHTAPYPNLTPLLAFSTNSILCLCAPGLSIFGAVVVAVQILPRCCSVCMLSRWMLWDVPTVVIVDVVQV